MTYLTTRILQIYPDSIYKLFLVAITLTSLIFNLGYNSMLELLEYVNANTLIKFNIFCSTFILIFLLNYKLNLFSVIDSIKKSMLFRFILFFLGCIFTVLSLNINIIYIPLMFLILISFILSKDKKKYILKLVFLISFWTTIGLGLSSLFSNIDILEKFMYLFMANYIADTMELSWHLDNSDLESSKSIEQKLFNVDLIKLESILLKFSVYYIADGFELYSNLNPENSGEILKALHELLQKSDLNKLTNPGGGGWNNWDPVFSSYIAKGLFLESDADPSDYSLAINLTSHWKGEEIAKEVEQIINDEVKLKDIIKQVDDYNNSFDYPKGNELIIEKNKINTVTFARMFDSPYSILKYSGHRVESIIDSKFFYKFGEEIKSHTLKYNLLLGAKYYYENNDNNFKEFWYEWHISQAAGESYKHELEDKNVRVNNFWNKEKVYAELYDNLLIVGIEILCKLYMYTNLQDEYAITLNANHVCNLEDTCYDYLDSDVLGFYKKAWEYYNESRQIYYPFIHHYDWHYKLFVLDTYSTDQLLNQVRIDLEFKEIYNLMPALSEKSVEKALFFDACVMVENRITISHEIDRNFEQFPFGFGRIPLEWEEMEKHFPLPYIFRSYMVENTIPTEYPNYKLPGMLGLNKTNYVYTNMQEYFKPLEIKKSLPFKSYNIPDLNIPLD